MIDVNKNPYIIPSNFLSENIINTTAKIDNLTVHPNYSKIETVNKENDKETNKQTFINPSSIHYENEDRNIESYKNCKDTLFQSGRLIGKINKRSIKKIENEKPFIKQISETNILKNIGKDLIKDISEEMKIKNDIISYYKENSNYIKKSKNLSDMSLELLNKSHNNEEYKKRRNTLPQNNGIINSIFKNIKINNIVNSENNEQCKDITSQFSIQNEKFHSIKKDKDNPYYVIPINSPFKRSWDFLIFILVLYTLIFTPIFLCFFQDSFELIVIEIMVELLYIFDFLMNFFTSIFDVEENEIFNLKQIFDNYFFPWFFFDVISISPIELITIYYNINRYNIYFNTYISIFSFLKWLKMFRMTKLFRRNSSGRFVQSIFIDRISGVKRVLKYTFNLFVLSHIGACLFIFIGKMTSSNENWIAKYNFTEYGKLDLYIASLYYLLVTVCTIGYGDITPVNNHERISITLIMFFSNILYSYAISSLSTMFSQNCSIYLNYKKKLNTLKSIKEEYNIPFILYTQIKKMLKSQFKYNKNDRYDFLESLPMNLKNDLMMIIYNSAIKHNKFFHNQPINFILYVLPLLKPMKLCKGETLISIGDIVNEMYFVNKGCLSISPGSACGYVQIAQIKKQTHFGDIYLQMNEVSPFEIKCRSRTAEVFVLKKEDFLDIKSKYNQNIFDILEDSLSDLKQIYEKMIIYSEIFKSHKKVNNIRRMIKQLEMSAFDMEFDNIYIHKNLDKKSTGNLSDHRGLSKFINSLPKINNSNLTDSPKYICQRKTEKLPFSDKIKSSIIKKELFQLKEDQSSTNKFPSKKESTYLDDDHNNLRLFDHVKLGKINSTERLNASHVLERDLQTKLNLRKDESNGSKTSKEKYNSYFKIKNILKKNVIRCQTLNFFDREKKFCKKLKDDIFNKKNGSLINNSCIINNSYNIKKSFKRKNFHDFNLGSRNYIYNDLVIECPLVFTIFSEKDNHFERKYKRRICEENKKKTKIRGKIKHLTHSKSNKKRNSIETFSYPLGKELNILRKNICSNNCILKYSNKYTSEKCEEKKTVLYKNDHELELYRRVSDIFKLIEKLK